VLCALGKVLGWGGGGGLSHYYRGAREVTQPPWSEVLSGLNLETGLQFISAVEVP
jgi:hypothetical protein